MANFIVENVLGLDSHEIVIKKSRFIASLARTNTVEEANDFIKKISKEHHDATHNIKLLAGRQWLSSQMDSSIFKETSKIAVIENGKCNRCGLPSSSNGMY